MLKSRLITTLLMVILMLPVTAEEPAPSEYFKQAKSFEELQQESINISQVQQKNMYKQPVSKRKIAKKFILAMSGVAISSIILFLMLTTYNRIREMMQKSIQDVQIENDLETPDNIYSAIKLFLDKTDWKN